MTIIHVDDLLQRVGSCGKYQMILAGLFFATIAWPNSSLTNIYTLMDIPFKCSRSHQQANDASHNIPRSSSNESNGNPLDTVTENLLNTYPNGEAQTYVKTENENKAKKQTESETEDYRSGLLWNMLEPQEVTFAGTTATPTKQSYDNQCIRQRVTADGIPIDEKCTAFEFDHSDYGTTYIEKYQLICERSWLRSFSNTLFLLGMGMGSQLFGYTSDKWGRINSFAGSSLVMVTAWAVTVVAPWYPLFAAARFFTGLGHIGQYSVGFVYVLEIVGPEWRMNAGVAYFASFSTSYMLLSLFAYIVKDATYIELIALVPATLKLLYIFLPESPRWLLMSGKEEMAGRVLNKMQKMNKKVTNNNNGTAPVLQPISMGEITVQDQKQHAQGTVLDVFKSRTLMKYCGIVGVYWMSTNLLYYSITYNSGALIPGNYYLTNFFLAAMEIPGAIAGIFFCGWKRTGRRGTCALMMLMTGFLALCNIPFILYEYKTLVTVLAVVGKTFQTICFVSSTVFVTELFPTEVRTFCFGTCSAFGRLGALVSTFTGQELASIWLPLPYLLFGVCGSVSGVLCLLLPETLNRKLCETIQEADELRAQEVKKQQPAYSEITSLLSAED